ncbi:hypothetical protein Tco_1470506, partial [Tanacetum coccineum]
MATKNRSSRRQKKIPNWFSNHVMESVRKKGSGVEVQENTEQVRSDVDEDIEKSFKVNEECINEDSSDGKGRENGHNNEGDIGLKNVQNKEQSVPEVSPKIGNSSSAR